MNKLKLAGAISLYVLSCTAQSETIDLLFVHDDYSKRFFNGNVRTAMQSWVNDLNQVYRSSNVDLKVNLVGIKQRAIQGADMGQILTNLRRDNQVNKWRNETGADFVSMLSQSGRCGVGYMSVDRDWAFNVVGPGCGSLTLAHELGHNMGLNHSWRQGDTKGSRYGYALGHGVDYEFATIMAYAWEFNTKRTARFSNPQLRCEGLPCGVQEGNRFEADSAKAIRHVLPEIAAFRRSVSNQSNSSQNTASNTNNGGNNNNRNKKPKPAPKGKGDGLYISYYDDINVSNYVVSRRVNNINTDWGLKAPHSRVGHDYFSVRWDGEIEARYSEDYTFHIKSDNGRRVWINNQLVIDAWKNDWNKTYRGKIAMRAGQRVKIRVEMFEAQGRASAKLEWSSPSQPRQVVPRSQLYQKF